jgi:uncharacterized protein YndB with AHSA1/START domain
MAVSPSSPAPTTASAVETAFEPRVGGHIYDRAADGSECRWAGILAYEPPIRVVFSWDIGPTWQLEADPANASEVEVRFVAAGANRTRVDLEHRHIDRHGPGWEGIYHGVDTDGGWPLYLTRYADLINGQSTDPLCAADRPLCRPRKRPLG